MRPKTPSSAALGAIKSLREPRAFVAWLLKLARTAWRHERTRWEAELPADLASPAPERPGEADALVGAKPRVAYSMCCTSLLVIVAGPALGWRRVRGRALGWGPPSGHHLGPPSRAACGPLERSCSQIAPVCAPHLMDVAVPAPAPNDISSGCR